MSSGFQFSDYFYHIAGSSDTSIMYAYGDPYSFPPFAYFLYSFFWLLNPYQDEESILNWQNYRQADNALTVFVVYNMLVIVMLMFCIGEYFQDRKMKYTVLLPTALIFSYPMMCTSVQRGNAVLLVALFLALAWNWMDSENKVKQELALICIAIASGFKLYPALTGLIYVKRKEWKKVVRLVIYGLVVTFVPFVFFGGWDGLQNLTKTLTGFATYIDSDKTNTVCGMAKWLGLKLDMDNGAAEQFAVGVNFIFFFVSVLSFFLSRKKWQEALFISGILVSFLASNWEYTLVYYLPALFLLVEGGKGNAFCERKHISEFLYSFAFGMIFSMDFLLLYYRYGLVSGVFTISYLMIGINMLSVFNLFFVRDKYGGAAAQ